MWTIAIDGVNPERARYKYNLEMHRVSADLANPNVSVRNAA